MLHDPELHYLDNAATTIVAPEVADVIDKAMREHWANPSSLYAPGARSEEALNAARAAVARTLGCKSKELYFTSCGSEGNNLALLGAAQTRTFGKGIVVSGFEHPSVQRPLERLAAQGYHVTVVKPQADGTLDINKMLDAVDKNTILVACTLNNGCGLVGRDLNSGWNCAPRNQGCLSSGISTISTRRPLGKVPPILRPPSTICSRKALFTS